MISVGYACYAKTPFLAILIVDYVRNQELKWERKEKILLTSKKKTENRRESPGAAVKLCLGDLLVMGSNPETASLHMQG